MIRPYLRVIIAFVIMCNTTLGFSQVDSVDITFYYKPAGSPNLVFVPGEFNNWGPNNNGAISANAPSRMNYDATFGQWFKTVRLRVGGAPNASIRGAYQYKFNENGSSGGWLSDPLNPRTNSGDNNNSILFVNNPTIHYLLPNLLSGLVTSTKPQISAYIYPATTSSIDTSSIHLVVDGQEYTGIGWAYDFPTKRFAFTLTHNLNTGQHTLKLSVRSTAGTLSTDSTTFSVAEIPPVVIEDLPPGIVDGINYIAPSTVTLSLFAPRKDYAYLIGDFNNWQVSNSYFMKLTPDSSRFWTTLSGLVPEKEYLFQYLVNGDLRIADPYTEKVSDPWNDRFITSETYPNLISYPNGKTEEIAGVLQTAQQPFQWQATNFERPAIADLVIYELLIRDFIARHDYTTMIDTLDYLQNLGINAIELLPVNEFNGNLSWGYNPAFYFAPDKYYGPANDLKRFIDECHLRDIAVILDMVLQHSEGQHPLVRLYNTGGYGPPVPGNPWYNASAPHTDFAFGYDFNHESNATKTFVDRVNAFWLQEYRIDGFRFDFTRGFTNRPGGSGGRDNSRIAILKRMADQVWTVDSTAYVILEHLIDDNSEMKELAEYKRGMMLWGNMNRAYSQSAMGWLSDSRWSSDLSWGYYKSRGWNVPRLITYMESHDEEWLMYRNLEFGRSSGDYDVKTLDVALERMKLVASFFLTLPGPKMLWQFGELGYDQELPENGRTDPKPILWEYNNDPARKRLYKAYAALLKLRRENETFRSPQSNVTMRVGQGQYDRRINISHPTMNATIIGNFDVTARSVVPNFQHPGRWYDYFSGDSMDVTDTQSPLQLAPGQFQIFTNKKLETPEPGIITNVTENPKILPEAFVLEQNYPNPFNPFTKIRFHIPRSVHTVIEIFDSLGRRVKVIHDDILASGNHEILWEGDTSFGETAGSGVYVLRVQAGDEIGVMKLLLVR